MKRFFIALCFGVALVAEAGPLKIELPVETVTYKTAVGVELANAQCLTCHSADYSSMQPPKPRDFWKAEVDKMKGKYGAPIATNDIEGLVSYFAKKYGTETNASPTVIKISPGPTIDAKALALKSGCFNCHQTNTKLIGPAYKDVAAKYRNNPEAFARVTHQITHGGSGQWGTIPMPPFTQFTQSEVTALSEWILSVK